MIRLREGGSPRGVRMSLWLASYRLNSLWRLRYDRRTRLAFQAAGLAMLVARVPRAWGQACDTFSYPPSCGSQGPVVAGGTNACCDTFGYISGGILRNACCEYTCTQLYCQQNPSITGYQALSSGSPSDYSTCSDPPGVCTYTG